MLDNLGQGRYDFGVGRGVRPGEFAQFGLPFDEARPMTEEAIEILLRAWTEPRFSWQGRFWQFAGVSLRPRPFQRPHPPLHEVASRPESVARVGSRGWPVALHFTPTETVARCVEAYHQAVDQLAEPPGSGPYRPKVLLCREVFVDRDAAAARLQGELALQGFWHLSSLAAPPPPADFSAERFRTLTTRVWGGQSYDALAALGGMLIGDPDQVAAGVSRLEAIGVDTLLLVCSFGNLSHQQVCRSLELFSEAVIAPRRAGTERGAAGQSAPARPTEPTGRDR
jgi:alkanesulfonate monooxygenase SsuD/methylene tetrahydromethanopterin reductase-like flavin-dependent oxidoreductase (luciferase family)